MIWENDGYIYILYTCKDFVLLILLKASFDYLFFTYSSRSQQLRKNYNKISQYYHS